MKLSIPEKLLLQHLIVLGKTGKGKSSVLRHFVEHLLERGKRVCIIDPKGDWYGLKLSADGRSAGFPVIAFGDFKEAKAQDVPINPQSGKHIAELVVGGNRPCVIGMRGWMPSAISKFWIDFAAAIFNSNSAGGINLVIDEVQNFAPKERSGFGEENLALHWTKRLMSEGRGLGLVIMAASQRPQSVHNQILTQCETLVAMGVIHESDRAAIELWIKGAGDKVAGNEVLNALAGLGRGEAYVWSPENQFGPIRMTFPMFETFDSFAPPQLQKKITMKDWSSVDLDAVKAKLAIVIEEAKSNDPAELKREIARLKAELRKVQPAQVKIEQKEVSILTADDRKKLDRLETLADGIFASVNEALTQVKSSVSEIQPLFKQLKPKLSYPFPPRSVTPAMQRASVVHKSVPDVHRTAPIVHSDGSLPIGERKILQALIQYRDGLERSQLTVLTGYKRSSRDTYIQRLREKGFCETAGELVRTTDSGIAALPDASPLPVGEELQQFHLQRLPQGEKAIFEILLAAYPDSVSREIISERTGYQRSSRDTYIQRMRAKMILTEPARGEIRAAETLFA